MNRISRQTLVNDFILRKNPKRNLMSPNELEDMIKKNIRGMDEKSYTQEILRLNIINKQIGYELPESQRIEKLVYAQGRIFQTTDDVNIKLDNLKKTIDENSVTLPFNLKKYQQVIDKAREQNNRKLMSDEFFVIDTLLDTYAVFNKSMSTYNLFEETNKLKLSVAKVIVKERFIFLMLDPHNRDQRVVSSIPRLAQRITVDRMVQQFTPIDFDDSSDDDDKKSVNDDPTEDEESESSDKDDEKLINDSEDESDEKSDKTPEKSKALKINIKALALELRQTFIEKEIQMKKDGDPKEAEKNIQFIRKALEKNASNKNTKSIISLINSNKNEKNFGDSVSNDINTLNNKELKNLNDDLKNILTDFRNVKIPVKEKSYDDQFKLAYEKIKNTKAKGKDSTYFSKFKQKNINNKTFRDRLNIALNIFRDTIKNLRKNKQSNDQNRKTWSTIYNKADNDWLTFVKAHNFENKLVKDIKSTDRYIAAYAAYLISRRFSKEILNVDHPVKKV